MGLASGTRLGPYEIRSALGAGGMGEVYRACDTRLGRDVAIKILPESFARDSDRLHRFELEARTVAALNHPNILALFDIGTHDGSPYIVSELLEGQTLRQRLEEGPLPARRAVEFALQVSQGLAAAHEKSVVHRDMKPENIFLTKDGRVKILDFGLAKLARPEGAASGSDSPTLGGATQTAAGMVMGTVGYMSPEQVRGKAIDPRSDIFSFGAVVYEMLGGQARLPGRDQRRYPDRDPAAGSARAHPERLAGFSSARSHRPPLPRKGSQRPLPGRARPRLRAGRRHGQQRLDV